MQMVETGEIPEIIKREDADLSLELEKINLENAPNAEERDEMIEAVFQFLKASGVKGKDIKLEITAWYKDTPDEPSTISVSETYANSARLRISLASDNTFDVVITSNTDGVLDVFYEKPENV